MKNLIMVDIQKEYSKISKDKYIVDYLYVEKIKEFIAKEQFDNIFCVVDCNSGTINIPYELFELIDQFFYKNYAGYEIETIEGMLEYGEMIAIQDGVAYKDEYDNYWIVTDNHHETQLVNEDLEELVDSIKNSENVLIGGYAGECLQDIEKVFDYFNIDYSSHSDLIYPIYSPKISSHNTIDWMEIDCP